jgi:hypothetical protein
LDDNLVGHCAVRFSGLINHCFDRVGLQHSCTLGRFFLLESQFLALLKLLGLAVLMALLDFHWRNPNLTQDFA